MHSAEKHTRSLASAFKRRRLKNRDAAQIGVISRFEYSNAPVHRARFRRSVPCPAFAWDLFNSQLG
jgi:hypothetical protein